MVAAIAKDKALIGAAGVFYVAAEISLRGMIALPTIRNTAGYDLIATSRDGLKHANIQVKTSGQRPRFWPICQRPDNVKDGPEDFYILVRRNLNNDAFEGFMLTGTEMKTELTAYRDWYIAEGKAATVEKFALCLCLDKDCEAERTANWRKRWQTWTLQKQTDRQLREAFAFPALIAGGFFVNDDASHCLNLCCLAFIPTLDDAPRPDPRLAHPR